MENCILELKEQKTQAEMRISAFIQSEIQKLAKNWFYINSVNVNSTPIKVLNKDTPIYYVVETNIDIKI